MFNVIAFSLTYALTHAAPPSPVVRTCASHLDQRTESRLRHALTRLLPVGTGPLVREKMHLTEVLVGRVDRDFAGMSPAQVDQFLITLETAVREPLLGTTAREARHERANYGDLQPSASKGLVLRLDDYAGTSLVNWPTLANLLAHLARSVSDASSVQGQLEHLRDLNLRKFSLYREQLHGYRAEFRLLTEAYPPRRAYELGKLLRATPEPDLAPLIDAGIVRSAPGPGIPFDVDAEALGRAHPHLAARFDAWVEIKSDKKFLQMVETAHMHGEKQFLRHYVAEQRLEQAWQHQVLPILHAIRWLSGRVAPLGRPFDHLFYLK